MVSLTQDNTTDCLNLPFSDQNLQATLHFLQTMTRHDRMHGPDTPVLIQPIAEKNKTLDKKRFIPVLVKNLGELYPDLIDLNNLGYSLHWAVNEYGYMSKLPDRRRRDQVTRVRSFAVDIDTPIPLKLVKELIEVFYPTCVVLSSAKQVGIAETTQDRLLAQHYGSGEQPEKYYKVHFYWQIHNMFGQILDLGQDIPLSAEETSLKDNWHLFQNALAYEFDETINDLLGFPIDEKKEWTDKGLLSLSQTLRLPGFFHLKDLDNLFISCVYYSNTENVISIPILQKWLKAINLNKFSIQQYWDQLTKKKEEKRRVKFNATGAPVGIGEIDYEDGYGGALPGERNSSIHSYAVHLIWKKKFNYSETQAICSDANRTKNVPPLDDDEVAEIVLSAWNEHQRQIAEGRHTRIEAGDSGAVRGAQGAFIDFFKSQMRNNNSVGEAAGVSPAQLISGSEGLRPPPKHVSELDWERAIDSTQRVSYDYSDSSAMMYELTSDLSIVERIKQRFKQGIKLHPNGSLWTWDIKKGIWVEGDSAPAYMASVCGMDMGEESGVLAQFFQKNGDIDEKAYQRFKASLHSERKVAGLLKTLKREPEIRAEENSFDANGELLNCQNATVDIYTGDIKAFDRMDLMTKKANVFLRGGIQREIDKYIFMETAGVIACNRWSKFVLEIMDGDIEMYWYLQKIAGYALTTSNKKELMFFFYGYGANGKSVFTELLAKMLADYSYTVPAATFLQGGKDRMSILSQLVGVRMVLSSELGSNRSWNEETIKDVTGTDSICVRPLYKQSFNYHPQFKVIVRGNYRPKIAGSDYGIWRRIRPVPFDRTFSEKSGDTNLFQQLSTKEMMFEMLCWSIAGLKMLDQGFKPPTRAAEAYIEYRNETMPILGFLSEVFDLGASGITLGEIESGVAPSRDETQEAVFAQIGESLVPLECADLVDSPKLHRLYLAWMGQRRSLQMSEGEVWAAVECLSVSKHRIMMRSETQLESTPKANWVFGLRIKPEWAQKIESGRGIYGRSGLTGSVLN